MAQSEEAKKVTAKKWYEANKEYFKVWRDKHRDHLRANDRRRYHGEPTLKVKRVPKTKEEKIAYHKTWYQKNKERIKVKSNTVNKEAIRQRHRKYYRNNKERFKGYHEKSKERNQAYQKVYKGPYRLRNKEKIRASTRAYALRTKYNITPADYDQMVESQKGLCCICRDPIDKLVVDHCHKTSKVRGLLCHPCNKLLGHAKDSIAILENAITYLTNNGANNVT